MRGTALQNGFFIALLVFTTAAFGGLILDFLMPVFWAVVFAVLFQPMYRVWLKKLRGRTSVAAGTTVLIIVALIILPLLLLGTLVSQEITGLYQRFEDGDANIEQSLEIARRALPTLVAYLGRLGIDSDQARQGIAKAGAAISQFLASHVLSIGQGAVQFMALLFLMLYFLFFFLRDGERLLIRILRALPLSYDREQQLLHKFAEVSRATIKGTSVTGAVQGTIGGVLFWILGLPGPVLWGVLMALLSFVPVVGPALIWGPAALMLLLDGHLAQGIILVVVGILVIGLVDNVLRPILVGRDARMPDFLVLLATMGGLAAFGVSGFVIGPILASFFVALWGMFEKEFHGEPGVELSTDTEHPVLHQQ